MATNSHHEPQKKKTEVGQNRFVVEGRAELGPDQFPLFVDGEAVGPMIVEHFRPPAVDQYYRLGRLRVTVELLDEED